jgi:hypothetical protein
MPRLGFLSLLALPFVEIRSCLEVAYVTMTDANTFLFAIEFKQWASGSNQYGLNLSLVFFLRHNVEREIYKLQRLRFQPCFKPAEDASPSNVTREPHRIMGYVYPLA